MAKKQFIHVAYHYNQDHFPGQKNIFKLTKRVNHTETGRTPMFDISVKCSEHDTEWSPNFDKPYLTSVEDGNGVRFQFNGYYTHGESTDIFLDYAQMQEMLLVLLAREGCQGNPRPTRYRPKKDKNGK